MLKKEESEQPEQGPAVEADGDYAERSQHPADIVASLVRHSQQGAQVLRENTLNVSIYKDAEKLRFKYEKGGILRDTSEEPTILQSVHQLLEENQMQHVMRFVETEKHHNAARPLLENL
ncbi:uncharacterized protein, partial [Littorina saxatilis]|uniref:uncharacterized protein n=1 Tax=Littorina saxatilis TaxID=31220 RepID=UPI0038B5A5A4